jgi:two-component system, cell cycle response regulator DivK
VAGELILVVEDNDKSRKLVRDVLAHEGYQLLEAESGEDGVRLAREHRPALVVMDIQLPGIDGIEALHQLRAVSETQQIPVIAVTASAMTADRAKIMAAGFNGYQLKPISVRPFLAAVRETLDGPARTQRSGRPG